MIRSICSLIVMVLVVTDGSCRQPGRTVPALVGAEDGMALERHLEASPDSGQQPPKAPEPPTDLRVRRFVPLPLGYVMARSMGAPVPRYMPDNVGEAPSNLRRDGQDVASQYPVPPVPPMKNPMPHRIPEIPSMPSLRARSSSKKRKNKPDPTPEPEPEEESEEEPPEESEEESEEEPKKGRGRNKKKSKLRDRRSPKKQENPEEKPKEKDEEKPEENPEEAMKQ